MPITPADITPFRTSFGRNLLKEVPGFASPPYLVVTMEDMWPQLKDKMPAGTETYFVRSMERSILEADIERLGGYNSFVGLGGGRAIDAAKYFAWRLDRPLHQFPTSLSVDAMFGHRSGVREDSVVRYVGWAVPECVYFDYDLIEAAPAHINRAGIGDVLCFFTGVWDWEYSVAQGRCEPLWPFDPQLASHSLQLAEDALGGAEEIHELSPRGIDLLVNAFKWGGSSYHATGWCPRHIEGVEHYFYYALEARTNKSFLHGQAVCLGLIAGAMMHDRRVHELRDAIRRIGVDISPSSMEVDWDDVDATLLGLGDYVREAGLPHGIAHDFNVDEDFLARFRDVAEAGG